MTIDLMALAKKADETYLDVETSFGTLRIYHVPDAMLLSVGPDMPEPELPTVRMKTATGFQERQAKAGDPEYAQWQKERADYEQEVFALRVAVGAVMALREVDWSQYDLPLRKCIMASGRLMICYVKKPGWIGLSCLNAVTKTLFWRQCLK
jgi:hypothetical protein